MVTAQVYQQELREDDERQIPNAKE
jgi:hypothetical protein